MSWKMTSTKMMMKLVYEINNHPEIPNSKNSYLVIPRHFSNLNWKLIYHGTFWEIGTHLLENLTTRFDASFQQGLPTHLS